MSAPLRDVLARFSIQVDDKQLEEANKKIEGGISWLKKFGTAFASGAAATAFFKFAEGLAATGDQINDASRRLGVSSDSYQALGLAAETGGSSIEGLSTAILQLQDRLANAAKGGDQAKIFRALGIATKDAQGNIRATEDVLGDAADAIARMDNPAKQTAAAVDLFGRAGRELLPVLKDGNKGFIEARKRAEELGGGFSEAAVKAGDEFSDAMKESDFAIRSVRGRIAVALLPVMKKLVDASTAVVAWFARLTKGTKIVEVALAALGAAVVWFAIKAAVALAPVIAPFLAWGAAIAGVILVLEDLYVTLLGGQSVTRDLIDSLLGLGATEQIVEHLKIAWQSIVEAVKDAVKWVSHFVDRVEAAYRKARELIGLSNEPTPPKEKHWGAAYRPQTEEQIRHAQRLAAAASGGSVRFPDETPAQAAQEMAHVREMVRGPSMAYAPRGSSSAVSSPTVNVTVNAASADAREVGRIVEGKVREAISTSNREAMEDLVQLAEPAR